MNKTIQNEVDHLTQTYSVAQTLEILREHGLNITKHKLVYGIAQGKFPFGIVIIFEGNEYIIFAKKLHEWIKEYLYTEEDDSHEKTPV